MFVFFFFFFFQAEDGIRDTSVTGVQTCALPIYEGWNCPAVEVLLMARPTLSRVIYLQQLGRGTRKAPGKERSEERRVGKECRSRWSREEERKKKRRRNVVGREGKE